MGSKSGLSAARSAETVAQNVAKQQVSFPPLQKLQTRPVMTRGIGFVTQRHSEPRIYGRGKLMVDDKS
jgi:hypothetical protein